MYVLDYFLHDLLGYKSFFLMIVNDDIEDDGLNAPDYGHGYDTDQKDENDDEDET